MSQRVRHLVILGFLCSFIFFFVLGEDFMGLTNPDEVFYAGTAKEMVQHHTWMTPILFDQPQFEKPIFLYWLLRVSYGVWGDSAFGYRFFPALFAMIGVFAVYWLGLMLFGRETKALTAGLILMSSGFYIAMARTVFTDMIFTVFIGLALASFYKTYIAPGNRWGIPLFYLFAGLAVLTKGPLGFAIPAATVLLFLLIRRDLKFLARHESVWGFFIFLGVAVPWYAWAVWRHGATFTHEFFYNDHWRRLVESEHKANDHWFFYPLSIVGGMFPWSLYVLAAVVLAFKNLRREPNMGRTFLLAWSVVVFCTFQVAHSKLVSYILPIYPAMALLTAEFVWSLKEGQAESSRLARALALGTMLTLIIFVTAGLFFGLAHAGKHPEFAQLAQVGPVFCGAAILSIGLLAILHAWFARSGRLLSAVGALVLIVPCVVGFSLGLRGQFGVIVSSRAAWERLSAQYAPEGSLVCSKRFVRAIRYYSGHEVAVVALGSRDFFSPHPIPFLDTKDKLAEYLSRQRVTYAVVDNQEVNGLKKATLGKYGFEVLDRIGRGSLIRLVRDQPLVGHPPDHGASPRREG